MTDQPYTDADLRAEAARQLATTCEDPDFMGIGEQMEGAWIDSTVIDPDPETGTEPISGTTWDQLGRDDYDTAQRAIDDLLSGAADLSDWAVNLGADGLEPVPDNLEVKGDDTPLVRVHLAFTKDMPDDVRRAFITGLGEVLAEGI